MDYLSFFAMELRGLICWPTREDVIKFYPDCFKSFPDVCSITDCTEIYLQSPSLAEALVLTYSKLSHNTSKDLASILIRQYNGTVFLYKKCTLLHFSNTVQDLRLS